ncbi:MAG TPA: hypothetical protein VFQ39_13085 [Longimicrobium sp.]|nr:hypothetical protein [Longimicrobium sp.]
MNVNPADVQPVPSDLDETDRALEALQSQLGAVAVVPVVLGKSTYAAFFHS